MKIAFIVCYKYPTYVRSEVLLQALLQNKFTDVLLFKNKHLGLFRYIEVGLQLIKFRFIVKPDVYFINFRGYEVLMMSVLLRVKQPIVFDEFINFTEWLVEHKLLTAGTFRYRIFVKIYSWFVRHANIILADTPQHAQYSAKLNDISVKKYISIPVSADEKVFFADNQSVVTTENTPFTVFYYGHMLPLHGLQHVIDAAISLRHQKQIIFEIVGGGRGVADICTQATQQGANIKYTAWLPLEKLAEAAKKSSLTLGGPFGGTLQSNFVVTGKTYQFLAIKKPVMIGQNEANNEFTSLKNCIIVPQQSSKAIAKAIEWSFNNPIELAQIAEQGHKLYHDKYSSAQIALLVEKVVDQLGKDLLYNH